MGCPVLFAGGLNAAHPHQVLVESRTSMAGIAAICVTCTLKRGIESSACIGVLSVRNGKNVNTEKAQLPQELGIGSSASLTLLG